MPELRQRKTLATKKTDNNTSIVKNGESTKRNADQGGHRWGLVMTFEAWRYIRDDYAKVYAVFYQNVYGFNFKYWPWHWIQTFENPHHMEIFVWVMLIAAICIMVGFMYRLAALFYFLAIGYCFCLESTAYLNHIYLTVVMSGLMVLMPCNTVFSIDGWIFPGVYSKTVPRIYLTFVRLVIAIVYEFAGIVKINEDWLRAEPLRNWLYGHRHTMMVGRWLPWESTAYFMSYGGMIYDLIVGPMLFFDIFFWLAIALTLFFHLTNKLIFNIGIFPWLMIASTSLYFSDDWPQKLIHRLKTEYAINEPPPPYRPVAQYTPIRRVKRRNIKKSEIFVTSFFFVFLLFWIFFPLRHYVYPGDVIWNELGHNYSWRMKLRDKECVAHVYGYQPLDKGAFVAPTQHIFSRRQRWVSRPWNMIQMAHFLGDVYRKNDTRAEIYVASFCQVNFRPRQPFSDPDVDLASAPLWEEPFFWISELAPLGPEVQDQYPWNWEWNFNWIRGKDIDNRPIIQAERKKLREEFEGSLFEDSKARFRRMIAEKHFDGNITAVGRLQFEYPPLPRDVGTGERIPRGSKLRDNGDHPKLPKSIRNILYRESALRYRRQ